MSISKNPIIYKRPKEKQKMSAPIIGRRKVQSNIRASHLQTATTRKKWEIITGDIVGTINSSTVDGNCGNLNDNGPRRLILLNIWSTVGSAVREGLRGVPLLEKVCQKLLSFPESSHPHPNPWLQLAAQDECSQLFLSLNLYSTIIDSNPLKP